MGRAPCCDNGADLKKGPWSPEEDHLLVSYISKHGPGNWRALPKLAGLLRCGKSCRLRWANYLRPDIKKGPLTPDEVSLVIQLHAILGNKWAAIASQLQGRTDNEIKNFWNSHHNKRRHHSHWRPNPQTHDPVSSASLLMSESTTAAASKFTSARHTAQWETARLQAEARLSKESLLFTPTTGVKTNSDDYFLQMWNSEVGESFRRFERGEMACESPMSQTSSSTKCGSASGITMDMFDVAVSNQVDNKLKGHPHKHNMFSESDSSSSDGLEDSSDTALRLLLDFPVNNDMSFLGAHTDDYYSSHND